jgi:hypothetical protein
LQFEHVHGDPEAIASMMSQIIFRPGTDSLALAVPKSKPFNFRAVFKQSPDIESLVKSHCSKDAIEKVCALGYPID